MSVIILNEFFQKSKAPNAVQLHLLYLASYAQPHGQHAQAYPSINKIAEDAGRSRRAVFYRNAKARKLGLLDYERSGSPVGTNLYTLYRPWRSPVVLPKSAGGEDISQRFPPPPLRKKKQRDSPPTYPQSLPIPSPDVQQRQRTCPHPQEVRIKAGPRGSTCERCWAYIEDDS